jgi:hypothetical protein
MNKKRKDSECQVIELPSDWVPLSTAVLAAVESACAAFHANTNPVPPKSPPTTKIKNWRFAE